MTTQLQFQQLFQAGCRFACSLLCMFYQNSVHVFPNAVYSTARGSQISGSIHCHLPSSPPGRAIAPPQWWATRLAPPPRPSPGSLSRWSRSNSRHPSPGSESHAASRVPEFRASECSKKKQATLPCLPG